MIALAIAAVPSAEASDARRVLKISHSAVVLTPGAAAELTRFAAAFAPGAAHADTVMAVASSYDSAIADAASALKSFHKASSDYASATSKLGAMAWSNTQSALKTASALNDSSPSARAGLVRAAQGAQAIFDSAMTIADLAGSYGEWSDQESARLESPASADGIAASYSAAVSGVAALQRSMSERVNWGRAMQALDDLSHDVMAVIGADDTRAVPRNTAFIQIKAAKDAMSDLRSIITPQLDLMAITQLEILRLAGRGL
jgi:hypothetical protein